MRVQSQPLSHRHVANPHDYLGSIATAFLMGNIHQWEKIDFSWGWTCWMLMQPNTKLKFPVLGTSSIAQRPSGWSRFLCLVHCSSWNTDPIPVISTWKWRYFLSVFLFIIYAILFRFVAIHGRCQLLGNVYVAQHTGARILLEAPICCYTTNSYYYLPC